MPQFLFKFQVKGKHGVLLCTYGSPGYEYKCCTLNLTFVVQVYINPLAPELFFFKF